MLVTLYLAVMAVACATARGTTWPTSHAARVWHPPRGFIQQALCIHRYESTDWHRAWTDWAGNRSPYAGGLQFMESTWLRAGGRGEPWQWSPREQVYRAYVIWRSHHGSWSEWGTRASCHLR